MNSRSLIISRFFLAAVAIAAIVGMTGATSVTPAHADQNNDPTCWISASPTSVNDGGSTILTWGSSNVDSGWISDIGDVNGSGSRTVSNLHDDTTFTYTVYGNGHTNTCKTTVQVSGSGSGSGYPSCNIHPSQNNIQSGQSTTLNWTSTNAQSAHLSIDGNVATNGSYTVYPTNTTTYTLSVYGQNGQNNQCQTTVYVNGSGSCSNYPYCYNQYYGAPSCTINLGGYQYNQNQIYNQTATLSWTSQNATNAYITNIGSVAMNGAQAVYPQQNQLYTLTVSGPGGSATCRTGQYGYGSTYLYTSPPAYTSPYVSLSQIPYTGLDFGPVGTAVYFLALAFFAIAGGYLVVYYNGGVLRFSFAQEVKAAMRNQARVFRSIISK
ncbi:hypothetical protein A2765_05695 [Candidatus Kaiserbacteria bacterium RIFCSPHIGHO2_01_FULL_56_24]|uniref:Ig-like domain-containing protein n=1 Tax=Candidatus Kaiserbacteria bacterium RIFCSPHIGHO2_01_FULL_56_24 TaxID=1798487 RepID=A0A1F6DBK5_9BACT|nr:MAG: hypothetical protein A2765_05695 [Candidatus Kaiserbacteria bacterium RIFCSPHIGHO2_01_FULL_56_24]